MFGKKPKKSDRVKSESGISNSAVSVLMIKISVFAVLSPIQQCTANPWRAAPLHSLCLSPQVYILGIRHHSFKHREVRPGCWADYHHLTDFQQTRDTLPRRGWQEALLGSVRFRWQGFHWLLWLQWEHHRPQEAASAVSRCTHINAMLWENCLFLQNLHTWIIPELWLRHVDSY